MSACLCVSVYYRGRIMHPQQCFLNQNKSNQSIGLYQQLVVTLMFLTSTVKWGDLQQQWDFVSTKKYLCVFVWGRAGGGQYCYFILFFTSLFIIDRPLSYQLHSVGLSVSTFPFMYTSVELVVISDLVARTNYRTENRVRAQFNTCINVCRVG